MLSLIARLVAIAMLRLGPQDLPARTAVLLTCIGLYVLVTSYTLLTSGSERSPAMVLAVAVTLPLILCWIVLGLAGRPSRWLQTVSALFGTSAVLSALLALISLAGGNGLSPVATLVLLAVFFWSFAVDAHIWKQALEVRFATALALAVILFAATLFIIDFLAGPL